MEINEETSCLELDTAANKKDLEVMLDAVQRLLRNETTPTNVEILARWLIQQQQQNPFH